MISHQKAKVISINPASQDLLKEAESMIEAGSIIVSISAVNPEHTEFLIVYSENTLQSQ